MESAATKRMNSFCRELLKKVLDYLQDEEHRKEFEKWYLQKYGKPYEWKKISIKDKEE